MRKIPSTMATQHPDNACAPFWETDGNGFVNIYEELRECMACYKDLGVEEFMWDWEGKYADEAVIDKLFSNHYEFFKDFHIGKEHFLTFRLPNIWKEQGYSLIRALMVILTSEDFAVDLKFHSPPLFEAILPMTEKAEQLMYIQRSFRQLARFKSKTFDHRTVANTDYMEIIPLVEGVESQLGIGKLLREYLDMHKKQFRGKPDYIRPFLARSDPALVSGLLATMLANKVALSDIAQFSEQSGISAHPIIGVGSLIFRGGLSPENVDGFLAEYGGVRTVTIQSAFRYDYPLVKVKKAILRLQEELPKTQVQPVSARDRGAVKSAIAKCEKSYQQALGKILKDVQPLFAAVPRRRERRQHIGFLAYQRSAGKLQLPRAINFTAALYSIGLPPEFIGLGRAFKQLSNAEMDVVQTYYHNLHSDLVRAGRYVNRENLERLAVSHPAWHSIQEDIALTEKHLGITLGPQSKDDYLHKNLSSNLLLLMEDQKAATELITETGKLRRSLG